MWFASSVTVHLNLFERLTRQLQENLKTGEALLGIIVVTPKLGNTGVLRVGEIVP